MPKPSIFTYSLEDIAGVKGSHQIFVSYDAALETVSAVLAAAAVYGGLLDAVTGAQITGFDVKVNALPDPSWKSAPIANIDMEQTLLETFDVYDTTLGYGIDVPALRDTLIVAGRPVIASGAIAALNAALVAPFAAGYSAQNPFLLDLTALRDAAVTFRSKRKGRKAVSKVRA